MAEGPKSLKKPGFGGQKGERRLELVAFCWPGSPLSSVAGPGSQGGVVASQPPAACRGSPDIGEQKLSVPVATGLQLLQSSGEAGGGRLSHRPARHPPPSTLVAGGCILVACGRLQESPPQTEGHSASRRGRGRHGGGSPRGRVVPSPRPGPLLGGGRAFCWVPALPAEGFLRTPRPHQPV